VAAQHRAAEVDEREDRGSAIEPVAERTRGPGVVAEDGAERERRAEVRVEPDVLQERRTLRGSGRRRRARSGDRARAVHPVGRRSAHERGDEYGEQRGGFHYLRSASAATRSSARSIGMWTMPARRSTQP